MSTATSIEWTHPPGYTGRTWNPVRGCTRVSSGCDNCYAMEMAHRFSGEGKPFHGFTRIRKRDERVDWSGEVVLLKDKLDEPLRRRIPTCYFVNSMSDLFHDALTDEHIALVFDVMKRTPQHLYQVLTKRSARLARIAPSLDWPSNVWMGVSVESNDCAKRADDLRTVPAAVRFISVEPMIAAVAGLSLDGIDWVIVGGESGPKARPLDLGWIADVVNDCRRAGAAVFVKQLGSQWSLENGHGPGKGNDPTLWPRSLRVREFPRLPSAPRTRP